ADIVFDIGAHIGFYSILFSRIVGEKGKVYSFEPSSEVSSALALTIDRLANTTLLPFGLSDKESDGFLFIPEDASAASLADWTNESLGKVHKISCQIKRLDDLLANNEVPRPDFIKCDVEGAEELVFRGGLEILDCKDAPIILFEVNEEASKGFNLSKTGAMDFLASLEKADFSFFDARTDALSQISEIPPPLPSALAVNILAVPKAKLNRLSN
ncbi:MAG: FkbM family methyltransferase, partial [Acidobacteria bacterium]|nr:FkbM family methyltransferase [Acidobacteriota bacterium]